MNTVDEFNDVSTMLNVDQEKLDNVVTLLSQCGGRTEKEATKRAMKEIMTPELASKFNWVGKKYKDREVKVTFSKTTFVTILIQSVMRSIPDATKSGIEAHIKAWLRNAPARVKSFDVAQ